MGQIYVQTAVKLVHLMSKYLQVRKVTRLATAAEKKTAKNIYMKLNFIYVY